MDRLFGLPAHPLLVHFPVVAIPAVAIAAIALVARPHLRAKFGPVCIALAVVTTVSTFMAAASGEELSETLDAEEYIETHETLGTQLQWIVLVLTLALIGLVILSRRSSTATAIVNGTGLAVALVAALALIWVIRTGHEGAKATWEGVLPASDEVDLAVSEETTSTSTAAPTTAAPATTAATTTTAAPTTTASSTTSETSGAPDTSAVPAAAGMAIYEANCQRCHRADGSGGRGPSLVGIAAEQPDPQDQILQTISGGRGMPAFGERLTPEEIEAVVDYIRTAFV